MKPLELAYDVLVSTQEESDYISDEIMRFNSQQVPFTQEPNPMLRIFI